MLKKVLSTPLIICLYFLFILPLNSFSQGITDVRITGDFRNESMISFFNLLEDQYHIKSFYKEAWLERFTINVTLSDVPLEKALNMVLDDHNLSFEIFQDYAILIFPERRTGLRSKAEDTDQLLVIGDPINSGKYKTATLTGRIIDGKTGESLPEAVIYNPKLAKGTTTDSKGNFQLEMPTGDHQLRISFVGFQESDRKIELIESGSADFELFEEVHDLEEITVVAEDANASKTQMSMVQINSKALKNVPMVMGERDVIKSIALMPGIQVTGELASGFNVRGGNTDQNLVMLDGSPVFNTSHLFGFLSIINPDVVDNLRVYKGGLSARYGERVSSIMEIDMKEGNDKNIKVYGGLGIINSRLTLEGPLTKNKKLRLLAAGRLSYTDWILKEFPDADVSNSVSNFHDYCMNLSYRFSQGNWIKLMGYISDDEFSTSSKSINAYGNKLFNLEVNNQFAEQISGKLNLSFSQYKFRLTDLSFGNRSEAYYLDNQIRYNSLKYDLSWYPHFRHQIHTGINGILYTNEQGTISPYDIENTVVSADKIDTEKAFEGAIYFDDEFNVASNINLRLGLRYSGFANFGPQTVYLYEPGKPKSGGSVVDSLRFENGELIKYYGGLEPRLALSYEAPDGYFLKASYQRTRQYINQISNNAVISPAETWKTADYHLAPLICDQIALGADNNQLVDGYNLSAEVYYKSLKNLIEYKNGAQIILNKHLETALVPAKGYSYGVEIAINKNKGRLTGWLNYVYSRTMRKTNADFETEQINRGKFFPSVYDKPHDFKALATYHVSRRWRVSGNFVFASGRPITLPELTYQYLDETLVHYSDRNKYRMPPYHRFDLAVTFDENLRNKRMWKGSWTFSIYNLYGRKNPYSVYYRKATPDESTNFRSYALFQLSVIGVPVPTLTYNFTF